MAKATAAVLEQPTFEDIDEYDPITPAAPTFSGAPAADDDVLGSIASYAVVEPGSYLVEIASIENTEITVPENGEMVVKPKWRWTFTNLDEETRESCSSFSSLTSRTVAQRSTALKIAECADPTIGADSPLVRKSALYGKQLLVMVENEEKQGKVRNKVTGYAKTRGGAKGATAPRF